MQPFPISLHAALPLWDVCAQGARGAGGGWSLGDLEPIWDVLENLRRWHQDGHTGMQPARVSAETGMCSSVGG